MGELVTHLPFSDPAVKYSRLINSKGASEKDLKLSRRSYTGSLQLQGKSRFHWKQIYFQQYDNFAKIHCQIPVLRNSALVSRESANKAWRTREAARSGFCLDLRVA
jgi:hypothetical protein